MLVDDLPRALSILRRLKALGVRIAMDDFGTGYSSLSNLQAFPFDKIKIDRSFISDLERNAQAATIVRAVIALGRGLNLPVVAEGVETQAQLAFLSRRGVRGGAGLPARPPASDLGLCRSWSAARALPSLGPRAWPERRAGAAAAAAAVFAQAAAGQMDPIGLPQKARCRLVRHQDCAPLATCQPTRVCGFLDNIIPATSIAFCARAGALAVGKRRWEVTA